MKDSPDDLLWILKHSPDHMKNIEKVTGISVRGWLCDFKEAEVEVLLGQCAETDSSGGLWETFGGKCDPEEMIFDALLRELDEESNLKVLSIHDLVGVEVFLTPTSKRWVLQLHFLIEAEKSCEPSCNKGFNIRLDQKEHQSHIWQET